MLFLVSTLFSFFLCSFFRANLFISVPLNEWHSLNAAHFFSLFEQFIRAIVRYFSFHFIHFLFLLVFISFEVFLQAFWVYRILFSSWLSLPPYFIFLLFSFAKNNRLLVCIPFLLPLALVGYFHDSICFSIFVPCVHNPQILLRLGTK